MWSPALNRVGSHGAERLSRERSAGWVTVTLLFVASGAEWAGQPCAHRYGREVLFSQAKQHIDLVCLLALFKKRSLKCSLQLDLNNNGKVKKPEEQKKRLNLCASSIKGSNVFRITLCCSGPDLFESSPHTKSISVAIILCPPQEQQRKNLSTLHSNSPLKVDILRVRWAICTSRSLSLLLVFRHGVWEKQCENLASHPKKKENVFWNPVAHRPPSRWETPLVGAQSARSLGIGQKTSGVPAFGRRPPRPRPTSYVMLASRVMLETKVSTEGTKGSSGTSGSQMAKVQLPFTGTGCAQRRHSWLLYCTASGTKGTCWNDNSHWLIDRKCIICQAKIPNIWWL